MKRLWQLLASPYFLSLGPFLVIVLLIHNKFSRYVFETESSVILPENSYVRYEDLDNDGFSERITTFDAENSTGVTVRKINGDVVGQWNFRGSFAFYAKIFVYLTGDSDENGLKEIYVFTVSGDSILLSCIPDSKNRGNEKLNRFLIRVGPGIKAPDPFIIPAEMDDLDGDGIKELIFGIGSGFSLVPRNVYAYFIRNDSLVSSPESSYFIAQIMQADIDGDGKREMIPYGYATGNVSPENAEYHDFSNFLMVLNQDLDFLFHPVEIKGEYSNISPVHYVNEVTGQNSLLVVHTSPPGAAGSRIYDVNSMGKVEDSLDLSFHVVNIFNTVVKGGNQFLITSKEYGLGLYTRKFELLRNIPGKQQSLIIQKDIDGDGQIEKVLIDFEKGDIAVCREGLRNLKELKFTSSGYASSFASFIESPGSNSLISLQSGRIHYTFLYRQNPYFPYYYLVYLAVYLGILGFAMIIKAIQQKQLRKKYDTEKKIAELQLALVRNQLDPHFTLNAINAVIYSVENMDREEAGNQLRRFSSLYRNLLLSAGSIRRTINEELSFCVDYLELEKSRFGDKFHYFISVADDVDRDLLIPKFIIQLYVENAVKHGLAPLESGGRLDIDLRYADADLIIEVTDNGVGRKYSEGVIKNSTGKGLEIMNELCSVYNKYFNEIIIPEISDLYNGEGTPAGTRVNITISKRDEKR